MREIPFVKAHGLGNDFVILREADLPAPFDAEAARRICDRRRGIGADGVLVHEPAGGGRPFMRVWNADGSEPEMCGNGIRCFALALAGLPGGAEEAWREIETPAGTRRVLLHREPSGPEGLPREVTVDMGVAEIHGDLDLDLPGGEKLGGTFVSAGNPHFVVPGQPGWATRARAGRLGPLVETHPAFPEGVNLELMEPLGPRDLRVRVWERGCGITEACGTGACASVAAAARAGLVPWDAEVRVRLLGGSLQIRIEREGRRLWMRGPAAEVARGTFPEALLTAPARPESRPRS